MSAGLNGTIAFSSGKHGDYDIWTLDLHSGALLQLTRGKGWNDKPRWSPDGRWIVFTSNVAGAPGIFRVAADGGGPVQALIQNQSWNDWPALSPDGRRLGFVANIKDNNELWIAAADGSNPQRVTTREGDDSCFTWMPDGKSVLYSSTVDGNADIYRLELASGRQQQLTRDAGLDLHPAASPDGRFIAFVSDRQRGGTAPLTREQISAASRDPSRHDRDLDIWLMTSDGRFQVRVTENQGSDRCVCWSPDGTKLLYSAASATDIGERLRIVDVSLVLAAMQDGDEPAVHRAAGRLRSASLQLDRTALEQEIEAQRHPWFFTRYLPDFLMKTAYGAGYFGSERYPDWCPTVGKTLTQVTPAPARSRAPR